MKLKIITSVVMLAMVSAVASSMTVKELKAVFAHGPEISSFSGGTIEAVVTSDCYCPNLAVNEQMAYKSVDSGTSGRTVFIQDEDGSNGVKLIFDTEFDNNLHRGDILTLNLAGTHICRLSNPDRLEVGNVRATNVLSIRSGGLIPEKRKTVSSLTDDDIFTFVTLEGVDFIFKDGCYANVDERYAQPCGDIRQTGSNPGGQGDSWGTLLRGSDGKAIMMHVNLLCPWRRNGKPVPQGTGTVGGIIDYCVNPRMGGNVGRYSIRPLDDSYINLKGKSDWKLLSGWLFDGTKGAVLDFELSGSRSGLSKEGVSGDRILNDVGKTSAYLWADNDIKVYLKHEFNSLSAEDRGLISHAAAQFRAKVSDWFNWDEQGKPKSSNAVYVEFSTEKLKVASVITLSFEAYAGNVKDCINWQLYEWCVQCSVNGGTWQTLSETASGDQIFPLRVLCWDNIPFKNKTSKMRHTPYENALGSQPKSFILPEDAIGAKSVVMRIAPASCRVQTLKDRPDQKQLSSKMANPKASSIAAINFGSIRIEYK